MKYERQKSSINRSTSPQHASRAAPPSRNIYCHGPSAKRERSAAAEYVNCSAHMRFSMHPKLGARRRENN
ncbi:hypothetical protein EVAR_6662_1 [Eumeta japonica]|uniref:Uncharacterized protein n=1 Tax=Eumeta variegata TaxID=151549 RepID=A0A4C1TKB6_EUMVA|nr:hypothetical protein EVAR_6662_1 [Eumeta japonica]